MNRINGKTKLIGVFGNPIEHTMSPFIHNALTRELGLNIIYLPFHIKEGKLKEAVIGAQALGLVGNNITVPYKLDVMKFVDVLDQKAEMIGAVNTLLYKDNMVYGYNTDVDGFIKSCEINNVDFKEKTVAILGAGGAANAILSACLEKSAAKLYIANRTIEKAQALADVFSKYYKHTEIIALSYSQLMDIKNIELCIQTTSIGMYPNTEDTIVKDISFFDNIKWAIDIIYNPAETMFLKMAKASGCNTLNGLGMLFYQGAKAYEIWNEIEIPEAVLDKCYNEFCKKVYEN